MMSCAVLDFMVCVCVGTRGQDSLCQPLSKWSTAPLNNKPAGICPGLLCFKKIKRGNKERPCLEVPTGPEDLSYLVFECLFFGGGVLSCLFSSYRDSVLLCGAVCLLINACCFSFLQLYFPPLPSLVSRFFSLHSSPGGDYERHDLMSQLQALLHTDEGKDIPALE